MASLRRVAFSLPQFGCRRLPLPSSSFPPRLSIYSSLASGAAGRLDSRGAKMLLKEMDFPELQKWVQIHGFRSGQALMLWKRLYGNNIWAQSFEELEGRLQILFSLEDGSVIETVVIPCSRGRNTVCVSRMNCQFCFTGRNGLLKHLMTAEIVEQAVIAQCMFYSEIGPMSHVVFMGMGEPFHNIDNVLKAQQKWLMNKGFILVPENSLFLPVDLCLS